MDLKGNYVKALTILVIAISTLATVPVVGADDGASTDVATAFTASAAPIKLVGFNDQTKGIEATLASFAASSERIGAYDLAAVQAGTAVVFINVAGLGMQTSKSSAVLQSNQTADLSAVVEVQKGLRDLILQGVPVLILADNPELFRSALAGLELPTVFQEDSSIYGYSYDPVLDAAAGFCVGSPNPTIQPDEVRAAYAWGVEKLNGLAKAASPFTSVQSPMAIQTTPYWKCDYSLSAYNNYGSYGQLNINTIYYVLENDGDSTYNYYVVNFGLQNVPGPSGLGQWSNADMWINTDNINDRGDLYPTRWLQNYQPTSTVSGGTVNVGFTQYGAPISWSYSINDVTSHDQGSYQTNIAGWWHDVNEGGPIGRQSYTIHPGMLVKTQQAYGGYYQIVHDYYKIQWYQAYIWPFGGWHTEQRVMSGQAPAPTA